jgi:hypothetical protein
LIETEFVFGKEVPRIERGLTKLLEEASLKFGWVGGVDRPSTPVESPYPAA